MGNNCSLDQVELEVLCYEFSDEVLEDEAATGGGKFSRPARRCIFAPALSSREIDINSGASNPNLAVLSVLRLNELPPVMHTRRERRQMSAFDAVDGSSTGARVP